MPSLYAAIATYREGIGQLRRQNSGNRRSFQAISNNVSSAVFAGKLSQCPVVGLKGNQFSRLEIAFFPGNDDVAITFRK